MNRKTEQWNRKQPPKHTEIPRESENMEKRKILQITRGKIIQYTLLNK